MNVGRLRCRRRRSSISATRAKKLEASLDMRVARVQLGGALVSIQGIRDLVVATLVLSQSNQLLNQGISSKEIQLTRVPRSYQTSEI